MTTTLPGTPGYSSVTRAAEMLTAGVNANERGPHSRRSSREANSRLAPSGVGPSQNLAFMPHPTRRPVETVGAALNPVLAGAGELGLRVNAKQKHEPRSTMTTTSK